MFEAIKLPEDSPNAFCLSTSFPLCVETVESTTKYHISKVFHSAVGPNGYVMMRTNIDYYFFLNEKQENVGTPLMSDSMTFSKDFVEILLNNDISEAENTSAQASKSERAVQTISTKDNSKNRRKKKTIRTSKNRHKKKLDMNVSKSEDTDSFSSSNGSKSGSDSVSSDESCEQLFIKECTCE